MRRAQPAVFLDRDGTLMEEVHYCARAEEVRVFPEVPGALQRLREAGFLAILITNQAGIGRGIFTEADYEKVHAELLRQIGEGLVDATYFCGDAPDKASNRRKPGIGMIEEACGDFSIDLAASWFIGDKAIDVECGQAAGTRTILVETGYGKLAKCVPTFRAENIGTAVDWILADVSKKVSHRDTEDTE